MNRYFLFWLCVAWVGFSGCNKCDDPRFPECDNYDPCYDDDGVDTVTKNMVRVDYSGGDFIPGVDEFFHFDAADPDDPTKTWTFTIFREFNDSLSSTPYFYLDNIPKGYKKVYGISVTDASFGYKFGYFVYNSSQCFLRLEWIGGNQYNCRLEYYNIRTQSKEDATKLNFKATKRN